MTIPGIYADTTGRIWNITTKPFISETIWNCQELDENDDDMGDQRLITVFNESTQAFRDGGKVIRQIYKRTADHRHIVCPIAVIMMPEEGEFGHGVVHESFAQAALFYFLLYDDNNVALNLYLTEPSKKEVILNQFTAAIEAIHYIHRLNIIQHSFPFNNPHKVTDLLSISAHDIRFNELTLYNLCWRGTHCGVHGFHNAILSTPYHLNREINPTYSFKEDYMMLYISFRRVLFGFIFPNAQVYWTKFANEVLKLPNLDIAIPYNLISSIQYVPEKIVYIEWNEDEDEDDDNLRVSNVIPNEDEIDEIDEDEIDENGEIKIIEEENLDLHT